MSFMVMETKSVINHILPKQKPKFKPLLHPQKPK